MKTITIHTTNYQLSALQFGDAQGIPMLAIHGWLDNAATFTHLAPLIQGANVIAIDLPGHGHSDHLAKGFNYTLFQYVFIIAEVLQALNWSRYIFLGHSLGGVIQSLLAATNPPALLGSIYLDCLGPLHDEAENKVPRLTSALAKYLENSDSTQQRDYNSLDKLINIRQHTNQLTYDAAKPLVERGSICTGQNKWQWRFDRRLLLPAPFYLSHDQVIDYLAAIATPIYLIMAENSFLKDYPRLNERKAVLQNSYEYSLPGSHHFHLQTPEPVASLINTAIKQLRGTP